MEACRQNKTQRTPTRQWKQHQPMHPMLLSRPAQRRSVASRNRKRRARQRRRASNLKRNQKRTAKQQQDGERKLLNLAKRQFDLHSRAHAFGCSWHGKVDDDGYDHGPGMFVFLLAFPLRLLLFLMLITDRSTSTRKQTRRLFNGSLMVFVLFVCVVRIVCIHVFIGQVSTHMANAAALELTYSWRRTIRAI